MTAREQMPVVLAIGDARVYCVGCKSWQPTEGYCEGDPDICPIGEEDQGRSPTLAEAQHAIDLLAKELSDLDDAPVPPSASIAASETATTAQDLTLRRLLWSLHGCTGQYGDDGELRSCPLLPVTEENQSNGRGSDRP